MSQTNGIKMPNFIGSSYFQTMNVLAKLGLNVGTVTYHEEGRQPNLIINQSIQPGEKVDRGETLNLDVSGKSLIRHLPSVYKKFDKKNNDFLKRFLWIFQHVMNSISIKLDNLETYFNPLSANSEFFRWLATWFAVDLEYEISEDKMRHLVKDIVLLYKWRGTAIGLAKYLEIVTGVKPEVSEKDIPQNEYIIKDDRFVENPIYESSQSPYSFVVTFPVPVNYFDVETVKKIHKVIRLEKPVHTKYYVVFREKDDVDSEQEDFSVIGKSVVR